MNLIRIKETKLRLSLLMIHVYLFPMELIYAVGRCEQIDDCTCKLAGTGGQDEGKIISMWQINSATGPRLTTTNPNSKFYYNPCTPFNEKPECTGVLGCQESYGFPTSEFFAIAKYNQPIITSYESGQVVFIYSGSSTAASQNRVTVIMLECQASVETPYLGSFTENPPLTYSAVLTTKCACPGVCPPNHSHKHNVKSAGTSTGTVLCILLFVFIVVYLTSGVLINKYGRKREGSEIIPNREFWKDLPILVKDGAVFTWENIRTKYSQYQRI